MVPGLLVSAFFLWWTFFHRHADGSRGFEPSAFRGVRFAAPAWLAGVVLFSVAGYGTRCFRSWWMLRGTGASFAACSRIFMTSLAANNVLPLRIGDVMRIFTYSGDVNATPSMVLSTVILEKLLDVFCLAALFTVTMHSGGAVSPGLRRGAEIGLGISTVGLLVLIFGAHTLQEPLRRVAARGRHALVKKAEHWLLLAMQCIEGIGVAGALLLVGLSFVAWMFEGLLYVSAAKLIALPVDAMGPWQAVSQANLSFLIPSSPGGIGPFEWACKDALVRHGATAPIAGLFGLLIHSWLFLAITSVGGGMFLAHRAKMAYAKPLTQELETLPAQLP